MINSFHSVCTLADGDPARMYMAKKIISKTHCSRSRKDTIMAKELNLRNAKLTKGEEVVVRGALGFTKYLTKPLEGEELKASVARRQYATDTPHYEGTITNPKVVTKTKGQPTDAEKVIAGRIYEGKVKDADGNEIKVPVFPVEKKIGKSGKGILFGVKREDGIHQIDLAGKSLLQGQTVEATYVTREYEYQGKKGLSLFLDSIVFVDGEPEIYKAATRKGWVSDDAASADEVADEAPTDEAPAENNGGTNVWD